MSDLFIVNACLALILGGLIVVILSPMFSIILNLVMPPKPVYKRNSSILHFSVGDVKFLRKRYSHKVALFGFSMSITGIMLLTTMSE